MKTVIVLLLFIFLIVISCDDEDVDRENWPSASGHIKNLSDSSIIVSAKVSHGDTLIGYAVYSDSAGFYQMPALGEVEIFVQKEGFITQSKKLNIEVETTNVDFYLTK